MLPAPCTLASLRFYLRATHARKLLPAALASVRVALSSSLPLLPYVSRKETADCFLTPT